MLQSVTGLLPFLLFAFVASITPGPTNILVLSNSHRYGLNATLPIIFGASASAAALVLVVGSGFGQSISGLPWVQRTLQGCGIAWLSFMSWQIFNAPVSAPHQAGKNPRRLGLWGAASLQLINPKTWMMAVAVVSVFATQGSGSQNHVEVLALVFFVVSMPCLGMWALLGAGSARVLQSPQAMQRFNRCMALLLLVSAWLSLFI